MTKAVTAIASGSLALIVAAVILVAGFAPSFSGAADHLDAPFVKTDGRIDINDVYAFKSPQNANHTVLVMTVNPAAGILSPTTLRPGARYEFAIDNNGDAIEDIVYKLQAEDEGDGQRVILKQATGKNAASGNSGKLVAKGWTDADLSVAGGGTLLVDLFDDPFFFDLMGFNAGAAFCGTDPGPDFFFGFNTTAIVLEVPTMSLLGDSSTIGVWGRTLVDNKQVERMARPAINTVFVPPNPFEPSPPDPAMEDAFNYAHPKDDQANFRAEVVDTLTLLYSLNDGMGDNPADDAATIQALANFLLPDILTFNTAMPNGFPNGRNLPDDVIDTELGLITEGLITTDCVDANNKTFSSSFPYLADPN